jgi:hypothetical protein
MGGMRSVIGIIAILHRIEALSVLQNQRRLGIDAGTLGFRN